MNSIIILKNCLKLPEKFINQKLTEKSSQKILVFVKIGQVLPSASMSSL